MSRLNGCDYCREHHAAGLERLLPAERRGLVEAFKAGDESGLTDRERAMCAWAARLTADPASMTEADAAGLRKAGLSDREILDVAQAAAYFAYANRIVLGLGARLEPRHRIGQWPAG